ncbi:hypothetical protein SD51_12560 [Alicyclobacillus tengchongensis]|nr:hypothetical protein SD51_12560 [Alicyclobacillus tengchongensis]
MNNALSPTFIIGSIQIHQISGASCLNMGNTWASGFQNHSKHNQGFGNVYGEKSAIHGNRTLQNDPDGLDLAVLPEHVRPSWLSSWLSGR